MGAVLPCSFARLHMKEDRKDPAPSTNHPRRISGGILATSFTRLHITPFTEDLQDRILAPSIKPLAEKISFHTKQTFPERGFGFVELPAMEAEKLKKRLNGATLKGVKVRVEDAKPERKRKEHEEEDAGARKSARRERKGREEGVVPGLELEGGRRVKRGWVEDGTSSKVKGEQSPAQHDVGGKKLRFRTMPPPNTVPTEDEQTKSKKDKKGKKDKRVVVEEFSKSKKALVTSAEDEGTEHGELSYEDGKGWVDQNGNVVEAERPSKRPSRRKAPEPSAGAIESTETNDFAQDDDMAIDHAEDESSKPENESSKPANSSIAAEEEATTKQEIHPLEALFKRPTSSSSASAKNRPKPIDTSFSFFDPAAAGEEDEDAEMGGAIPPKTPNTRRDLEWRSVRSAAPTPDTAAIGRKFSFPFAGGEEEEEDDEDEDDDAAMEEGEPADAGAGAEQAGGEESGFRKWFYEHRGEFNRGWKKRRREEKKARRQRENRRVSRRVV